MYQNDSPDEIKTLVVRLYADAYNGIENVLEQNPWWNYVPHFIFCVSLVPAIHINKLWLCELLSIIGLAYSIFLLIKPI